VTFPADRSNWKQPRKRVITAHERDQIIAAIRVTTDLDAIAAQFDLSRSTIEKLRRYA
jgi:hypothetical protein